MYNLNKTPSPIFHWAQAAPTRYRDRSRCSHILKSFSIRIYNISQRPIKTVVNFILLTKRRKDC